MPRYFLTGTLAVALAGSLVPPLAARQGNGNPPTARAQTPGQPVYEKVCSGCHGTDGRGTEAPSLVPFGWNFSQARDIVRHGGPCGMPAFTDEELSDEELKQIVDYLKQLN